MENGVENLHLRSVSARVLAYSHVFRSKHPTLFIRGETSRPINIVVRNSKSLEWIRSLELGVIYTFTRLVPSFLWRGSADETKVLEATLSSEVRKIKVDLHNPLGELYSNSATYVGKVSRNGLSQFGLIELEDGSTLCTSFVKQFVYLPSLQPTDTINIFNTHSKIVNGKTYFVMCGLSRLLSHNESFEEVPKHPVVDYCVTRNLGLQDLLKVISLFVKLEKLLESLSSSFYSSVLSQHVPKVLESVYPGIQGWLDHSSSKEVYKEFLISPHQCRPMKVGSLEKLEVLLPDEFLCLPAPLKESSELWSYKLLLRIGGDIGEDKNVVLVGKLDVDLKTGFLSITGGCKINCLIPEDNLFKIEIRQCVGKLVVIKGAYQVFERFMIHTRNKEQLEERLFNYILLYPGSISSIIIDKSVEQITQKGVASDSNVFRESENNSSSDELMDVENEFLSQRFVLHHTSSPVILESRVMFFAVTSLIGGTGASCSQESDLFSRWRLFCMQGSMLQYFPFLCENRVYEIRYPKSYGAHYFDKSSSVPELGTAKKILPCIQNGVLIPYNSSLCGPFESAKLPEDSVVSKEIYGVNDALLHAPVNDVLHVKGILLKRIHQTPKYQSYFSNGGRECGIPGGKNIVLHLQDISNSMVVNVYVIKWTNKQYPLGLLPGATICIKFVEKRCSSRSNSFFQSTCLTSIKVLEYPAECYSRISCPSKIRRSYLKQETTQSLNTPFWTILSIFKIWSVEFAPECDKCGSEVNHGSFECRGCARHVIEPVISCKANISVGDGTGIAYLRIKNDHVRHFLDLGEEEWNELKDLSLKKKLRYIRERQAPLERFGSYLDGDQLAFKLFCEEMASAKLWKVVCRKFIGEEEGALKLFCLDVKEVDFDLAESLVESLG